MAISFKKLAQAAAVHAVSELSDAALDDNGRAAVSAKGLEALETLKQEAAAENKAFLATEAGIRKLAIAKLAGHARLAVQANLCRLAGSAPTSVQAKRGSNIREKRDGKFMTIEHGEIALNLRTLLHDDIQAANPAMPGAKPAKAPVLALLALEHSLAAEAVVAKLKANQATTTGFRVNKAA